MNEDKELLEYLYKSSEMGRDSLTNLLKELKDKENKLKGLISDELSEYEKFFKKSQKLLKKYKADISSNSLMIKIMSKQSIKKEVKNDNSDVSIAHMLIEGLTMGVVDIETKINNFKDKADKDILNLCDKYLKFQQKEIEKLKKYL